MTSAQLCDKEARQRQKTFPALAEHHHGRLNESGFFCISLQPTIWQRPDKALLCSCRAHTNSASWFRKPAASTEKGGRPCRVQVLRDVFTKGDAWFRTGDLLSKETNLVPSRERRLSRCRGFQRTLVFRGQNWRHLQAGGSPIVSVMLRGFLRAMVQQFSTCARSSGTEAVGTETACHGRWKGELLGMHSTAAMELPDLSCVPNFSRTQEREHHGGVAGPVQLPRRRGSQRLRRAGAPPVGCSARSGLRVQKPDRIV